ncbi:hypothetical protein tinsulaeT_37130 [Thalassotalea insulae]|uniref:Type VI secretion system component TssM1 N-terminal domain-containing protein n=2 Tax=Thalassotalea insulae TaxID=2056778 RepID=A0ABQ6GWQ4_9GAMM|nr:hypothetical protein tinsulaeT_37130 [Thalassotalea insulae]
MGTINRWLYNLFHKVSHSIGELFEALIERLYPIIEQLKPIWQDPLWQALTVVFALVLTVLLGVWLFKRLKGVTINSAMLLGRSGSRLFKLVAGPLKYLACAINKRSVKVKEKEKEKEKEKSSKFNSFLQTRKAMNAIQYLTTQREWRYKLPWTLLMGENGSGKSQLINAVKKGRRTNILPRERRLTGADSGWNFFDHGVIIEPDNNKFRSLLGQLQLYRPERPIDNIILCISAKTLLSRESPAVLEELGEQLFQQLWQTQKISGFILPVYLFITHCDEIEGYKAFWEAHGEAVEEQMIGWSNPYRLDIGFNMDWIKEIFQQLLQSLQNAQLSVAAGGKEISDIDKFMLFLHEFSKLQAPLEQVMKSAFARSSLQEALPLRGVYFTGKINENPQFVEDVFQEKIFAEKNLCSILEKRRFSSNKLLRRIQIGIVTTALLLIANMGYEIVQLEEFNQFSVNKLQGLIHIDPDCTAQGADTYRLLMGLSDIGDGYDSLAMPLSWFDYDENQQEGLVATHLFQNNLFHSMECRLKQRAEALIVETQTKIPDAEYSVLRKQFHLYQMQLISFEKALSDFMYLSGPIESEPGIGKRFADLLNYLYDNKVPKGVNVDSELIVGAIQATDYDVEKLRKSKDLISRKHSTRYLNELSEKLHEALLAHVENVPVDSIQNFTRATNNVSRDMRLPPSNIQAGIREFQLWLKVTKEDWLATSPQNSPCGLLLEQMQIMSDDLTDFGYDSDQLARITKRFSQPDCDEVVRDELLGLTVAPFGELFRTDVQALLSESQELKNLIAILGDIAKLSFVKNAYAPVVDSSEGIVLWQVAPLQQLVDVLLNYQAFTSQHGHSGSFNNALQQRLQNVTRRLLSEAMIRPSQQVRQPKPVDDLMAYQQHAVSNAVNSFKSVREPLLQVLALLQQQGDNNNVLWLNQQVQGFVGQQLELLEQLVMEYHLYQPVASPEWQKPHFTQAMFNLGDDKKIQAFLLNQRQRLSYFAFNYAQPLMHYLQNSESGLSDILVQRWQTTLQDLAKFDRGEPNNQVALLDDLIATKLVQITDNQCPDKGHFDVSHDNLGWFAFRRDQIERQVNLHCASADKKAIINRYMRVSNLFNTMISGYFPFADVSQAGVKDIKPKVLMDFLEQYRLISTNLLSDLTSMMQKDDSIPRAWRDFIVKMDGISNFFSSTWQDKAKTWQTSIDINFDALGNVAGKRNQAKGSNQVIEWSVQSGNTLASFPNGAKEIMWQPGDPLVLNLRWATGSAYLPLGQPDNRITSDQFVDHKKLTATFQSKGNWGLFQWLQEYGLDLISLNNNEHLLSFYVPVAIKGQQPHLEGPAYVSRSNLMIQAVSEGAKGELVAIPIPHEFPVYAPGLNE